MQAPFLSFLLSVGYLNGNWRHKMEDPFSLWLERHWSPVCRTRKLRVWASLHGQSCYIDTNSWKCHGTSHGTEVLLFSFWRPLFNCFQSMTHVQHLIYSMVLESGYVAWNCLKGPTILLELNHINPIFSPPCKVIMASKMHTASSLYQHCATKRIVP